MERSEYGAKNMKAPSCPVSVVHQWTFGMCPNEKFTSRMCSQLIYSNCVMLTCKYGPKSEKGPSRFWPQFIYYFGQVKENCPLKSILKTVEFFVCVRRKSSTISVRPKFHKNKLKDTNQQIFLSYFNYMQHMTAKHKNYIRLFHFAVLLLPAPFSYLGLSPTARGM